MAELDWPASVDTGLPVDIEMIGDAEVDSYVNAISSAVGGAGERGVTIAYTAMHGVGGDLFRRVLERGGHRVHSVTSSIQIQTSRPPRSPTPRSRARSILLRLSPTRSPLT